MSYCSKCGQKNNSGSLYCFNCGNKLDGYSAANIQTNNLLYSEADKLSDQKLLSERLSEVSKRIRYWYQLDRQCCGDRDYVNQYYKGMRYSFIGRFAPFLVLGILFLIYGMSLLIDYGVRLLELMFGGATDWRLATAGIIAFIISILIVVLSAFFIFSGVMFSKKLTNKMNYWLITKKIPEKEKKLQEVEKKKNELFEDDIVLETIDIIPEPYRYCDAIDALSMLFLQGRVSNMQEACNLYEMELHQKRLEDRQIENLEIQKRQLLQMTEAARMSKVNAVANVVNVAHEFLESSHY